MSTKGARMVESALSEFDLYLIGEGTHYRAYEKLGAHLMEKDGRRGVHFAVWAPNSKLVSVIGDFNDWNPQVNSMRPSAAGVWEAFVRDIGQGARCKYHIESRYSDYKVDKADPYSFAAEIRPQTASRVWNLEDYSWHDDSSMVGRAKKNGLGSPISIYELHLGSWRRVPEEGNRWLSYRELAPLLAAYVHDAGFTHIELLPIMEHPFDGSWGYQTTGYFAPTSRFGTPADFMYLIDYLPQQEIGVILDWVPAHFPRDEAGLGYFDGSHLYEHADPRQGEQPDEWHLLNEPFHAGLKRWVRDLNTPYRGQPLLHELEFNPAGFEWVDCTDFQRSIISLLRRGQNPNDQLLFVCNFTPVVRENYRVGVPWESYWKEILNSDAPVYGGSGRGNFGGLQAAPLPIHGRPFSLNMTLPPLGIVVFQPESNHVA
jgi:1,4-alpha-glucan branching enzyme